MEFIGKTKIDFIGKRKIAFAISIIVSIIGIMGIVQMVRGEANLGIDFSGGNGMTVMFEKPVAIDEARNAFIKNGLHNVNLQEVREGNKLLIKVRRSQEDPVTVSARIEEILKKELPQNPFVVESNTEIGPSIGDKLRRDTLIAVTIAMIGIIIYIAIRFDFKFGIAAAAATLHDVLAMFAVFYLFHLEIDLLFITAVLTIAGYSLTDTVVVFDRIRENLRKNLKEPLQNIFNYSINEVLSRTIITSLTTFLAASSLLFFGGEVIHNFALALVVGIVVGTYSSVFVASPIVVMWENRSHQQKS